MWTARMVHVPTPTPVVQLFTLARRPVNEFLCLACLLSGNTTGRRPRVGTVKCYLKCASDNCKVWIRATYSAEIAATCVVINILMCYKSLCSMFWVRVRNAWEWLVCSKWLVSNHLDFCRSSAIVCGDTIKSSKRKHNESMLLFSEPDYSYYRSLG